MTKITETIPDDMPDWAIKAMAEGKFFEIACEKVRELEQLKMEVTNSAKSNKATSTRST